MEQHVAFRETQTTMTAVGIGYRNKSQWGTLAASKQYLFLQKNPAVSGIFIFNVHFGLLTHLCW